MDEGIDTTEDTATRRKSKRMLRSIKKEYRARTYSDFAEAGELRKVALPRKLMKLICVCPKRRQLRRFLPKRMNSKELSKVSELLTLRTVKILARISIRKMCVTSQSRVVKRLSNVTREI